MSDEPETKLRGMLLDLMLRHGYVVIVGAGYYRFRCGYITGHPGACPNNNEGLCMTAWKDLPPTELLHIWDGCNLWKCPCG